MTITRLIGSGRLLFAAGVGFGSTRPAPRLLTEAGLISAGDRAWVVATVALLATGVLTTAGVVVAVAIGLMVADLGIAQLRLRYRVAAEVSARIGVAAAPG